MKVIFSDIDLKKIKITFYLKYLIIKFIFMIMIVTNYKYI